MARSFRPLAVGVAVLAILGSRGHAQPASARDQNPSGLSRSHAEARSTSARVAGQQPPAQQQPPPDQPQPPPAQPQPPPVFRGGINFVRVDVIVSDNKSGVQIADLKESDFDITED